MYAMPKIHISNNILAKTRRTCLPQIETFEKNLKENTTFLINNLKKQFPENSQQEQFNPQHEEMVKYIHSTWTNVMEQYESKVVVNEATNKTPTVNIVTKPKTNEEPKISYFSSKTANIPKFEPFDLESFWSEKIYQKLISA